MTIPTEPIGSIPAAACADRGHRRIETATDPALGPAL